MMTENERKNKNKEIGEKFVNGMKINKISEMAEKEIQKALNFKTKKYAYLNFDNF